VFLTHVEKIIWDKKIMGQLFSDYRENSYCNCFELLQIQFVPHLCVNDANTIVNM